MVRVELEPAFLLHSRAYRETSFIFYVLTENHGIVHLIKRGARAKHQAVLQPFARLQLSWSGRGELFTMTRHEYLSAVSLPDFNQKLSALYMNELILNLVPAGSPCQDLFELYSRTLQSLAETPILAAALRGFEIQLLDIVGHPLQLDYDIHSEQRIRDECIYLYEPNSGPRLVQQTGNGWNCVSGKVLKQIRDGLYSPDEKGVIRKFLGGIIQYHLNGKPIHSRDIIKLV